MSYKIGDVSKLLGLPVETIRFYEKEHILNPARSDNGKYRMYDTWDIFFLMECMKYRNLNFTVKDIAQVLHKESIDYCVEKIRTKRQKLHHKIEIDQMLENYMTNYERKLETIALNEGNFWFTKTPKKKYIIYTSSEKDNYQDIDLSVSLFPEWLKYVPFVEFGQHISIEVKHDIKQANKCKWSLIVDETYIDALGIPLDNSVQEIPQQLCLSTIINAGNKGDMSAEQLAPALNYLEHTDYTLSGDIIGNLLTRVHKNGDHCRFLEMMFPVKKKT